MALPDQDLIALLADVESDLVERKESAARPDRLSEASCAFANDMPGYDKLGVLFVGVSDNGAVLGRPVTDELLCQLAALRDQGAILPPPTMTVRKLRVDGGEVAVVEVRPSVTPPVRFKGRVHIRVGITSYSDRIEVTSPGGHTESSPRTTSAEPVSPTTATPRSPTCSGRSRPAGESHGCFSRRGGDRAAVEQCRAPLHLGCGPPLWSPPTTSWSR